MSGALMKNIKLQEAPKPTLPAYRKPTMEVTPQMRRIEYPSVYKPRNPPTTKRQKGRIKKYSATGNHIRHNWTEDQVQIVIDMYNEGLSLEAIGRRLNCSANTASMVIGKARREGKIQAVRINSDWTPEMQREMARLYKEGKTYKFIAQKIGRSVSNTHKKIRDMIKAGELEERERAWKRRLE